MTAKVVVEMSAKDAEVHAAWQRARNDIAAFEAELSKINGTNNKLEASGKRVWEQTRTPLERYNAELDKLSELLKGNAIDQETYNRAVAKQQGILQAAEQQLKSVDQAQQAMEAAGKRVWESTRTPLERYTAELDQLDQLLKTGKIDQQTYNRALAEQNTLLHNTDERLKKVQEDNQKLEASGKRVWEQNRTPLERYNQAIEETDRLLKSGKISQETHTREVSRQKDLYSQATKNSKSFMGNLSAGAVSTITQLTGIGSIFAGIAAVVAQVSAEYQNMVSRQKTAADRQIDTAAAQRQAIGNLGDDPTMNAQQLDEEVARIAQKTGVNQKDIYSASSSALSARGQLSAKDALAAVEVAALNAPDDTAGLATMAGSLLDMQKKGGGTARQNVGQFIAAKMAARVETNTAFSQNVIPAAMGVQEFGDSPQQALALTSAITQGMGDTQGAMSGTAAISLAQQLERALPKMGSTIERIQFLQSPEGAKMRDKLLGKGSKKGTLELEKKAFAPIRGLLSGKDTVQAKQLDTALGAIKEGDESEKVFEQNLATVNAMPIQQNAAANRALNVAADNLSVKDVEGGKASVAREGLDKVLKAAKVSDLGQKFLRAEFEATTQLGGGVDPLEFIAGKTEAEGHRLQTDIAAFNNPYGPGSTPAQYRTAEEKQTGAELLEVAKLMREMVAEQKRTAAAAEEANKKADKPVEVNVQMNGNGGAARGNSPTKPRPAEALNAGGA